jgi:transcriptional regulator MraZ
LPAEEGHDDSRSLTPPSSAMAQLILGEAVRRLDDRYRLSIPSELADALAAETADCILAKERPGCLSLWSSVGWKTRLDEGVGLIESKIQAGRLEGRLEEVQQLGRLLSTRHRSVQLAGRGRLIVPEGFREFLGAEPASEVMVVGAAVCVEIWQPDKWSDYVGQQMPEFRRLLDQLAS